MKLMSIIELLIMILVKVMRLKRLNSVILRFMMRCLKIVLMVLNGMIVMMIVGWR